MSFLEKVALDHVIRTSKRAGELRDKFEAGFREGSQGLDPNRIFSVDAVKSYLQHGSGLAPLLEGDVSGAWNTGSSGLSARLLSGLMRAPGNIVANAPDAAFPEGRNFTDSVLAPAAYKTLVGMMNPGAIANEAGAITVGKHLLGSDSARRQIGEAAGRNLLGNTGAAFGSGAATAAISGSPLAGLLATAAPFIAAHQGYNPALPALAAPALAGLYNLIAPKEKEEEVDPEYEAWLQSRRGNRR